MAVPVILLICLPRPQRGTEGPRGSKASALLKLCSENELQCFANGCAERPQDAFKAADCNTAFPPSSRDTRPLRVRGPPPGVQGSVRFETALRAASAGTGGTDRIQHRRGTTHAQEAEMKPPHSCYQMRPWSPPTSFYPNRVLKVTIKSSP